MTEVGRAYELLQPGESALVIFTRGIHFETYPDGTGSTGYWKVSPNIEVDRVIIYLRQLDGTNDIYAASPGAIAGPNADERFGIRLKNVEYVGRSTASWYRFADTQSNPIRYLSRE